MPAPGFRGEDPDCLLDIPAHLEQRRSPRRELHAPSRVVSLTERNMQCPVPHILPAKSEALFRPQRTVDQNRGNVTQQVRVLWFLRRLSFLSTQAGQGTAIPFFDVCSDLCRCRQIPGLLVFRQYTVAFVNLIWPLLML